MTMAQPDDTQGPFQLVPRPQDPILLTVDQELGEGAGRRIRGTSIRFR